MRIYEIVRPLIKNVIGNGKMRHSQLDLEKEYNALFLDPSGAYDIENTLYDIEIHNNLPQETGMFSKPAVCDFCSQVHKENCLFAFQDDVTLDSILNIRKFDRELELTINWKPGSKVNFKMIDNPPFERVNLNVPNMQHSNGSKNISVYDCLSCFGQEETLAGNDKWYCTKCKDHVPAFKKMEIYKTPEFLVVHFKRFSHTRNTMFGSRKLNVPIDFPIEGLDLSSFQIAEQQNDGD